MADKALLTPDLAIERGNRIRILRESIDFKIRPFCKRHGLKPSTLSSWELGKYGGLSTKGGLLLVDAFKKEGLEVSLDWLLDGKGPAPIKLSQYHLQLDSGNANPIVQELQLFHQLNPNAVDAIVSDSGLEPCIFKDDIVAGIRQFGNDIECIVGSPCIVQLQDGQVLVRKLAKSDKTDHYTLLCTNIRSSHDTLKDVKIFSAARIIWHRRPN